MKRALRNIINELAIDNCNHLALHGWNLPTIDHPESSVWVKDELTMMTQIVTIALAATTAILTAFPVDMAHHHCDDVTNPLCTPKGFVEEIAKRGSGRIDPTQPPVQQG